MICTKFVGEGGGRDGGGQLGMTPICLEVGKQSHCMLDRITTSWIVTNFRWNLALKLILHYKNTPVWEI